MKKVDAQLEKRYGDEIEQLHNQVLEIADSKNVAEECLQTLCQARVALSMDDLVEIEYYLTLTKSLLARAKKSKEYQECYGRRVVVYELLWLAILLLLFPAIMFRFAGENILLAGVPIQYYIWGGVGGVMAALYDFVKHTSQRDIDIQSIRWYYIKPVLGIIIGPITYLLFSCIIFALGLNIDPTKPNFLIMLVCWIAGFSERFSLGLVDTIIDAIFNFSAGRKIFLQKLGVHERVESRK